MRDMPKRGSRTATNKKTNPFGKGESKAMEAKEKKMAPDKKTYTAMEKRFEGKKSTSKK